MVLVRIVFVAVAAIMVLVPLGPPDSSEVRARQGLGFCERYGMTCSAGVELFGAFVKKLSYAGSVARQSLRTASGGHGQPSSRPTALGDAPIDEQRLANRHRDGRTLEWPRN